ncbi:hypothetical protein ETAA8_67470 [Anatilimnocola aggregata]|uniref:Uncharacterized protein n=1 Tax=Anatilimnocola aggregata TaxID=2528021 RepID=A0A517YMY9_9BACT|nr:hypothetical protein [Anatilimnocola aggregata]QDU31587.1 hypothetical protein ETAA8_67470 [Anatilimnocola aggregata]
MQRLSVYCLIGGSFILALHFAVQHAMPRPMAPEAPYVFVGLFGICPALLWLWVTSYVLVIDERGVSRFRLWCWKSLWTWEAFRSGKIVFDGVQGHFIWRERPLWDRWLPLAFSQADSDLLLETTRQLMPEEAWLPNLATRITLPHPEKIKLRLFLTDVQVTRLGYQVLGGNQSPKSWSDVTEFRVERTNLGRDSSYRIKITLPVGRPLSGLMTVLWLEADKPLCPSSAPSEEWLIHLQSLVPPHLWKYFRTDGKLQSREEGEFRLARDYRELRSCWQMFLLVLAAFTAMAVTFVPKMIDLWNTPYMPLIWKLIGVAVPALYLLTLPLLMLGLSYFRRQQLLLQMAQTRQEMAALPASHEP